MIIRLMTATFALAFAVSSVAATASMAQAQAGSSQPAYLFSFQGEDAEVAPVSGRSGTFTLTVPLSRGNQLVTWFTDRPDRDAGRMTMQSFVDLWAPVDDGGFDVIAPNVAITAGKRTIIATMTDPQIITVAEGQRALQSTMTLVNGKALKRLKKSDSFLTSVAQKAGKNRFTGTVTLPTVSVFVDDFNGIIMTGGGPGSD
ncbi:MAG TPA: hypothetical protein VGP37_05330 [Candidatus Nanopelagicales bacterium]|nr:hypothetical protein [Candidatus Nanopelagicales bacterium]